MSDLLMPKLSDTMEEGTVLKWLVADGADVTRGQDIVEIETDKADMTVQAPEDGPLHIVAPEGSVHPVGAPIAHIGAGATGTAAAPPAAAADDEITTNIPVGDDGTPDEISAPLAVGGAGRPRRARPRRGSTSGRDPDHRLAAGAASRP